MGNKYIIELEDKPFHNEDGDSLCRVKGFNSLVFDMTGISKLAHYHEPDLEQVKANAYKEGFKDGQYAERSGLVANYEQDRETIQVGDVVRVKNAPDVEIWVTDISDEDGGLLSGLALKTVDDNCDMGDTYANRNIYNFERTGKHYDVPTVLEKMRGEQDG